MREAEVGVNKTETVEPDPTQKKESESTQPTTTPESQTEEGALGGAGGDSAIPLSPSVVRRLHPLPFPARFEAGLLFLLLGVV